MSVDGSAACASGRGRTGVGGAGGSFPVVDFFALILSLLWCGDGDLRSTEGGILATSDIFCFSD